MELVLVILVIGVAGWVLFVLPKKKAEKVREVPASDELRFTVNVSSGPPTEAASTRRASSNGADAWEGGFYESSVDPLPSKVRLHINYADGNDQRTERVIKVRYFDGATESARSGLLLAHCEMRDANRSFRYDRITSAVDMETGEVVTNIQSHLRRAWEASPEYAARKFDEEFQGPLEVLMFIARADGRVVVKERAAIVEFARKYVLDQNVTDEALNDCQQRSKTDPLLVMNDGVNLTHLGAFVQAADGAFFAV